MDTYQVGDGAQLINLSADIDVVSGLAASRAIMVDINTGNGISVAHSTDVTGDIALKEIASANALKTKRLSIFTKIDLLGNDKDERKKEFDRINALYTLSGGAEGRKDFKDPDKTVIDDDYLALFLNKNIDLI